MNKFSLNHAIFVEISVNLYCFATYKDRKRKWYCILLAMGVYYTKSFTREGVIYVRI